MDKEKVSPARAARGGETYPYCFTGLFAWLETYRPKKNKVIR